MIAAVSLVLRCMQHAHDGRLILLAGLVCASGIYASFALAQHAARSVATMRTRWGIVSIVASGATA
ncbi:MAG: diguanylate cyclase, partial [Sphingomonas sp.]